MAPIGSLAPGSARLPDAPERVRDAAQQFEALLLGQILRAARETSGAGTSDCALEYAEQQFAAVMARNGGLGLASLIVKGLEQQK
jgi:Rod binding domain-containing protein